MARSRPADVSDSVVPVAVRRFVRNRVFETAGLAVLLLTVAVALSLASWSVKDPNLNHAVDAIPRNWLGAPGATIADILMQLFGIAVIILLAPPVTWATRLLRHRSIPSAHRRVAATLVAALMAAAFLAPLHVPGGWPLPTGLGGLAGDMLAAPLLWAAGAMIGATLISLPLMTFFGVTAVVLTSYACCIKTEDFLKLTRLFGENAYEGAEQTVGAITHLLLRMRAGAGRRRPMYRAGGHIDHGAEGEERHERRHRQGLRVRFASISKLLGDFLSPEAEPSVIPARIEPRLNRESHLPNAGAEGPQQSERFGLGLVMPTMPNPNEPANDHYEVGGPTRVTRTDGALKLGTRIRKENQPAFPFMKDQAFTLPPLSLLAEAKRQDKPRDLSDDALEQNARMLEGVLEDFGVRGEIINVRPGPVVTLYELEPAPGIKSSRVIGLADDIARSMSAVAARVAVVPGRNVIGIELPNSRREVVYLRELLASEAYEKSKQDLALALGKNIGGEPVFADLARMPHLLIAGTTGSGKSVGINTMILSLLYKLPPEECKLIMIDPKMLELSVYEGIPHLLSPVVTDPKKAVVALKWAVREMEDRYRKMSKLGVRNIDGYNSRIRQALRKNETLTRTVQTGYCPETGQPLYEHEEMPPEAMPYIVVIVDEMADLMMVAGKEIEAAIQRLAQMARAAGIHLLTATQRPSVDVITGTIKANFPTRVSFQVTSKIDSRTILGEQGAEQLLGQGDMLYMAGGGRITRLHGAFVSDDEVEAVVRHLKEQGAPEYREEITEGNDDDGLQIPGLDIDIGSDGDDLFAQAVAVVIRDKKASTSYVQRRLQIGYNRAASLIERMENEGIISAANHAGKREILIGEDSNGTDG